jgi:hypothetical protein
MLYSTPGKSDRKESKKVSMQSHINVGQGKMCLLWFLRQMDILASMKYQDIEDILVLFSRFSPRSIRWGKRNKKSS